jgi:hypothetical protein
MTFETDSKKHSLADLEFIGWHGASLKLLHYREYELFHSWDQAEARRGGTRLFSCGSHGAN